MDGNYNDFNDKSLDDLAKKIVFSNSHDFDGMNPSDWIKNFLFDDSNERQLEIVLQLYGKVSLPKTHRRIDKGRKKGHQRLFNDYFVPNLVYADDIFQWRFQMAKHVFLRIIEALFEVDPYFQQKVNVVGNKGLSPLQKCIATMHMLAYGVLADAVEDVILVFECEFLCTSNSSDVQCFLKIGQDIGFPDMMENIDRMYWKWKDYPQV